MRPIVLACLFLVGCVPATLTKTTPVSSEEFTFGLGLFLGYAPASDRRLAYPIPQFRYAVGDGISEVNLTLSAGLRVGAKVLVVPNLSLDGGLTLGNIFPPYPGINPVTAWDVGVTTGWESFFVSARILQYASYDLNWQLNLTYALDEHWLFEANWFGTFSKFSTFLPGFSVGYRF